MNGAGTQESPYIIMTADDLYSVGDIGTDESYFRLGADIDMNTSKYADMFMPIALKCLDFDGNNHMIRNVNLNVVGGHALMFWIKNDGEESVVNIHGLMLENIRLIGNDVYLFASWDKKKYVINFEYCTFNLNEICYLTEAKNTEGMRNCIIHDTNISVTADYCTFAVNVDFSKTHPFFSGDSISHTQIKADMSTYDFALTDDAYNALFSGVNFADSYFFGTLERRNNSASSNYSISSSDCIFSRFYMVFVPVSGIAVTYWRGTLATPCFYDSEELKKYIANARIETNNSSTSMNAKNMLALTTEQCKSAEYLQSVNFDCMEG